MKSMYSKTSDSLAARARALGEQLRENRRAHGDAKLRGVAGKVDGMAIAGARSLIAATQPMLARYTGEIVEGIERVATRLRHSSAEDLARNAHRLATRNPGLFVAGAFVAGMLLGRYFKATSKDTSPEASRLDPAGSGA